MALTEASILSAFLLAPAPLQNVISLKTFVEAFPRSQQSSPHIRTLHRNLQHQRATLIDTVAENIDTESKRGHAQRRKVVKMRKSVLEEQDDEADVEKALFGSTSNLPNSKSHNLASLLPELSSASEEIEAEIQRLDEEAEAALEDLRARVGALSDLRYGRLSNLKVREQIIEGVGRLESSCDE